MNGPLKWQRDGRNCQTQKTVNTSKISGMLIVYWPITIKFRIRKENPKPQTNRPFPSSPGTLFQNEGRCSAFDMETIFHFHKKGCAPSLILKVRVFGTRKWPITVAVCDFVISRLQYWLISRNTITFQKDFWCSRFCEFHSKKWRTCTMEFG